MLFLVQGVADSSTEPTPEFLQASRDTLEQLGEMQKAGKVKAGGVMIGPMGVCFIVDADSNEDLHLVLTTMPSFRFADWEVMPLIPFHRDIEMSLDDALERSKQR
jgi:muconolactone delta-isomerase